SEDVQDVVRGISTGVRRMRSLVSSLHQLSKLESISIEREVCDLPSVVAEGRSLAAIALEESKAAVVVDALPRVQGSSELLAQLFQNLFSNACKYAGDSPPRIRIWSEVNHERGVDLVYFEDRGVGIPLKSQERVFESFHRLHHSDDIEGTGIGLSICRRIVQAHDGKLYIDPDYADGVRFVIALPLSVSGGA
ncbi:MAG: ATP-binding protein, partial [Pseudomonadota bacterium]